MTTDQLPGGIDGEGKRCGGGRIIGTHVSGWEFLRGCDERGGIASRPEKDEGRSREAIRESGWDDGFEHRGSDRRPKKMVQERGLGKPERRVCCAERRAQALREGPEVTAREESIPRWRLRRCSQPALLGRTQTQEGAMAAIPNRSRTIPHQVQLGAEGGHGVEGGSPASHHHDPLLPDSPRTGFSS